MSWSQIPREEIPGRVVEALRDMGADDAICTLDRSLTRQVRFANSTVTASKSWDSLSVEMFAAVGGRVAATSTSDLDGLDGMMKDLMSMARMMEPSRSYAGIATGTLDLHLASQEDMRLLEPDIIFGHVEDAINSAVDAGADRCAGVLYESHGTTYLASSGGPAGSHSSADLELSLRAMTSAGGSGHAVRSVSGLEGLEPERVGGDAGVLAAESSNPVKGDAGRFDVLFSPLCFANFLDRLGSSASAGMVDAGLSFLKDMEGKQVASSMVTVHDDGTLVDSVGAVPFDAEGVRTRRNTIIQDGMLRGYLHNTSTARRWNTESTGNAGLVFPGAWTVCLEPGDASVEDLLSRIRDGLYITNTWYTRFQNYQTGDFSTIPRDAMFRVKDGTIAGPVRDLRISENMRSLFGRIAGLGKESQQVHWWEVGTPVFTPHVLVEGVNITRSTQ